jgi:hypothetical protein
MEQALVQTVYAVACLLRAYYREFDQPTQRLFDALKDWLKLVDDTRI